MGAWLFQLNTDGKTKRPFVVRALSFLRHSSLGIRHSLSGLALPVDNPFVTSQLFQPAGPAGVEFVGADADFGAEAEFAAVVEPRAGIDHHGGAVDACCEFASRPLVGRNDRIGMMRTIGVDVLDRLVERADNFS